MWMILHNLQPVPVGAHCEAVLKENHRWPLLPVPMNSATIWLLNVIRNGNLAREHRGRNLSVSHPGCPWKKLKKS
jgi:hypothetical protein